MYHCEWYLSIISIEWQISTSCGHMERPQGSCGCVTASSSSTKHPNKCMYWCADPYTILMPVTPSDHLVRIWLVTQSTLAEPGGGEASSSALSNSTLSCDSSGYPLSLLEVRLGACLRTYSKYSTWQQYIIKIYLKLSDVCIGVLTLIPF